VSDSEFDVKGLPSRRAWDSSRGAAGMSMVFKLRWREKHAANVPLVTRPRFDLALICPDAVTRSRAPNSSRADIRAVIRSSV
jgi:hypothetical protein